MLNVGRVSGQYEIAGAQEECRYAEHLVPLQFVVATSRKIYHLHHGILGEDLLVE